MFCPSCGFEYSQKTNYCKRCGEDLNPAGVTDMPKKKQPNVTALFWGVIAFCLASVMLLLIAFEYFSRKSGERCNGLCNDEEVMLGFVASFISVVALLLVWQLGRMITAFRRTGQDVTIEKHFIREVPTTQPAAPAGQMPEVPEAIHPPSVAEHTTRQMAGVYGEPKAMK
jgi:hypothetical protein